jgi:DNA/RNA-binding domain of Phe-tRNA-synthetase-like protein
MPAKLVLDKSLMSCPCQPALIWAEEISPPAASQGCPLYLDELVRAAAAAGERFWPDGVRERVRRMLRYGKYKPSGRSKPASEFLLQAAAASTFPVINAPVDINNAISLESGFPASILDLDLCGDVLLLRRGRPGERYVFNPAGQSIELEDLLLVAKAANGVDEPCANPVKDSMATKVSSTTRRVAAILYAPRDEPREMVTKWAERFAHMLREQCQAKECGHWVAAIT